MATEQPPAPAPDELDQFFELIAPAWAAAVVGAWEEEGRPLSPAEIEGLLQRVTSEKAGDAFREIYGADVIAAVYDGKKPS